MEITPLTRHLAKHDSRGLFTPQRFFSRLAKKKSPAQARVSRAAFPVRALAPNVVGFGMPAINNSGTIVFPATLIAGQLSGVQRRHLHSLNDCGTCGSVIGGDTEPIGAIGLNDAGTIVFDEGEYSNDNAIFTPSRF